MQSSGVRVPPPIYFACGLIVALLLNSLLELPSLPVFFVPIGQAVLLVGMALATWGFSRLYAHETTVTLHKATTAIVSDGPYRFSRNPLYVSNVLMYTGIALWMRSLWAFLLLVPIVVLVDRTVIPKEETYLEYTFGDEYLAYKRSVRRWL